MTQTEPLFTAGTSGADAAVRQSNVAVSLLGLRPREGGNGLPVLKSGSREGEVMVCLS
jgi:hypothetical protein